VSQMLTIDTERLTVTQLSIPTMSIQPNNADLLNRQFIFTVNGESKNEYTN
jgi:hypothetical protein